ncbi:MAG: RES family NAD+ phosphorylase, partial [Proteobacteria bacterium]|nr:RES family NAD+ phosphorylase [Pseudomonadota bacterium]
MHFGKPSPSQIFAELVRAGGFDGILYESTKGPGQCLAIFPSALTHASLADAAPAPIKHTRLDSTTAEALCGWDDVAKQ